MLLAVLSGGLFARELPDLPPLTTLPDAGPLPGKFVWADLFSSDFDTSRDFYRQLFDFDWQPVGGLPERYGIFLLDGEPVAGLSFHQGANPAVPYGHWVHYLSVPDVEQATGQVVAGGGAQVLAPRTIDRRGDFSIVAGPDDELLGLIRSSAGDPADDRARPGEWVWWELFTPDSEASVSLYRDICDCLLEKRENGEERYLMVSQDQLRAGINPLADGGSPGWLGFVRVASVSDKVVQAQALGGRLLFAPDPEVLSGRIAVIEDPTGASVGLITWDLAASEAAQ
ncbi:glyoxalase [Marinobacterium nitratireducens]|uniref:Glyoxalase n=1 Tax=Marinobacterium nitratireducens TaxID=518897 RepID=A0A918DRK0_9GAMM|nr:glyoxalase [Marinobacterium nitratireducens]